MSSQEASKKKHKRKSHAVDHGGSSIQVSVEPSSSSGGPVFANFPSVRPADHIPFTLYTRDFDSEEDITRQRTILAGETDDVEFVSNNRDMPRRGEGADCQYLPAIYDPSTSTLVINPSAPLYLMSHTVKRLKTLANSNPAANAEERAKQWRAQRNDLGETFGTKKAKSQIKAEERNKVDVGAMEGIKGHLMGSIHQREEAVAGPPENIPTPNLTTTEPAEVYPRASLIPDEEWTSISVTALIKAEDDKSRLALLPWRRGMWISGKIRTIMAGPAENRKTQLRYLVYLCALHHFLSLSSHLSKMTPTEISEKSRGIPQPILNGLIKNFAQKSGTKGVSITEKMKAKLLSWICVLSLKLDGGVVEVARTAGDLKMTDAKVMGIFKSVGCVIEYPTPAEREAAGLSLEAAKLKRKAVLKAPVKYPKPKTRAGPRR